MSFGGKYSIRIGALGRLFAFSFAMASAATATIAQDEAPTGSRLGSRHRPGTVLAPAEAAQAAMNAARCMDFKHPSSVRSYLLANDAKISSKALMREELDCLGLGVGTSESSVSDERQFSFPEDIMRGMLAEAEIQRTPAAFTTLQPLKLEHLYSRTWFAATTRNAAVDEMATCLAAVDPQGITELLKTRSYTPQESTAFAGLSPKFGPCLRAGAKLQANRQAMRAALAEALFQRAYSTGAAVSQLQEIKK